MKQLLVPILLALSCNMAAIAQSNLASMNYKIHRLAFNSKASDFSPTVWGDKLVFCHTNNSQVLTNGKPLTAYPNTDLYAVKINGSTFGKPQKIKGELNSNMPENAVAVFGRNKKIMITRARQSSRKNPTVWALYESQQQYGKWSRPLLVLNKPMSNIAYPTLSADGQTLYFAADLNGGYGGMDLYMCQKIGENWGKPINLGSNINTPKDEVYPQLSANGVLFFASNGVLSMGGYDLFFSRFANGQWDLARPLPEPINSKDDDFSLTMASATTGYFSSNRNSGSGKKNAKNCDIYSFSMEETIPNSLPMPAPIVQNESALNPIFASSFDYSLLQKDNKVNEALGLHQIRFAPNDSRILPQTQIDLDKVVYFLQQNPVIVLDIIVHTETRGDADANLQLSTRRANAIKNYFQAKFIRPERLMAHGFGEKFPINYCKEGISCPPEKHDENNRVEFTIISGSVAPPMMAWEIGRSSNTAKSVGGDNNKLPIKQVALKEEDMFADANHPIYKVALGPFVNLDNRVFFDHNLSPESVKIETTPKGKIIIVGKYRTAQEANQRRAELDRGSTHKASVLIETVSPPLVKTKPQRREGYELLVGPFKHIDTETFHKFATINSRARMQYLPDKGSMIAFGNLNSAEEAEKCKQSVWNAMPRKTEAIVMTIDGKTISAQKKK